MRGQAVPVIADLVAQLRAAGCVYAEDEARILLDSAGEDLGALRRMLARRAAGEPLEQVVGWAGFDDLRVYVEPGVFVPRQRTVFLVEEAARLVVGVPEPVVVDLCCGSGAVGLAIASRIVDARIVDRRGGVRVVAADVDAAAVRCARRNLAPVGGEVHLGDLYAPLPPHLRGTVHLLVANVPYVPSAEVDLLPAEARLFEPRQALDGGPDGLDTLRRVAAGATAWLAQHGHLLSEVSERQAGAAVEVLATAGLTARVATDEDRGATLVVGTRQG